MRPLAIRAHPIVLGVSLFLASELMFFAGLFAAYFDLRAGSAASGRRREPTSTILRGTIGTVLLALSSGFAMRPVGADARARPRRRRRRPPWLLAGIVSALLSSRRAAAAGAKRRSRRQQRLRTLYYA